MDKGGKINYLVKVECSDGQDVWKEFIIVENVSEFHDAIGMNGDNIGGVCISLIKIEKVPGIQSVAEFKRRMENWKR